MVPFWILFRRLLSRGSSGQRFFCKFNDFGGFVGRRFFTKKERLKKGAKKVSLGKVEEAQGSSGRGVWVP